MRVLAFAASSSRHSINKALVRHAVARLKGEYLTDVEIEFLDLNDYEMPIYSIDREREGGIPEEGARFFEKIGAADGVLIAYAEHNGFYTAAFKNVFDWASRIEMKVFQGKPQLVLSTSPGRGGGAHVLETAIASAPHFGAEIVASLSIPSFRDNFDLERGELTDDALAERLGAALARFARRLT